AMKARESLKLDALRGIKKELLEAKTAKGAGDVVPETEIVRILQKMVKQRRDSAEIFNTQGRPELAEKELAEAQVIAVYLPAAMTPAELEAAVSEIIAKTGASSIKDLGKVMGVASKELAGKAEGKDISGMVKKLLNS
ncbi:MAG: GatB/YqeY domain-containing protein, partial [Candidatus Atribacteria bacterium]|nr:GatB/YqeY domain-containing protein [Candidatus Atribacteria bacterium]MBN2745203.1 GatB/YqeY domain-containing protein [Bacteroidales bacterium]